MSLAPYRLVLARPGVPALLLISLLARVPLTAAPVVLTLHVVLDLHRGFAAAGALGAVFAIGGALGSPLLGRGIDRFGLRPVLVVTTVAEGAFWCAAPELSFEPLLVCAFVAGVLAIPIFSLTRQALSAMVPPAERKAGFSLDSMGVELSFAVGPAAGIALMTQAGATTTLLTIAVLIVAAGASLVVADPPTRSDDARLPEAARTSVPSAPAASRVRPAWLTRPVVGVLVVTFASTFVVVGTDTALTGVMTSMHQVQNLSVVFVVWCLASLVGGFLFGATRRRFDAVLLLALLSLLCLPVALATSWPALTLLIVPTGLFCAPVMSVTAEVLTASTPAAVRGLVLGLHASALTIGNAVGAPVTGLVLDHAEPRLSFAAVGVLGLVLAVVGLVLRGRAPARPADAALDARPAEVVDRAQATLVRSGS